ncbi:MAG: amidohydrolase, partial [bacterium]
MLMLSRILFAVTTLQCVAADAAGALQAAEPADLILHHGKVVTLDAGNHVATAVVIRDGVIVAVGNESLVKRYNAARTIDLRGRMLMPGFNDA